MYNLVVGTIFKNESHIMEEWLNHYFERNVEHIYMINDKSTDDYINILQPYIDKKMVTLYHTDNCNESLHRQNYYWFNTLFLHYGLSSQNTMYS